MHKNTHTHTYIHTYRPMTTILRTPSGSIYMHAHIHTRKYPEDIIWLIHTQTDQRSLL